MIARAYSRLKVYNPVPSRYELWEEGERTKDIPIERVIGGPAFRNSDSDCLLQMADFIAHALLKQEEAPSPGSRTWAFTKPSPSSITRSTARRRGETPRESSGGEGMHG